MPKTSRLLLVLLVVLLVSGTGAAAATPNSLQQLELTTQQIRGLAPLHPVAAAFLPDKAFNAVVQSNERRGETDAQLEISRREMVVLGLLGPTVDYRKLIYDNITSQVLGLYDFYAKKLYVRNESGKVFGIDRYAIAHEYTHALQDQHYHLKKLVPDESGVSYKNTDAGGAHHALLEGDAVNTQLLYISRAYTPREIHDLVTAPAPVVKSLPLAIQREFDFPYTAGLQFVQKLYRLGGMSAVDGAYARLPGSTFEIMHPSYYQQHWHPVNVRLHSVVNFPDWTRVDDDVNGAFGIELILWEHLSKSVADSITASYRGDRYLFLENGTQDAMLLKTVWASPTAAGAAMSAWLHDLKKQLPNSRSTRGKLFAVVTGHQSVYLRVVKNSLIVAYAPTEDLARHLGTSATT